MEGLKLNNAPAALFVGNSNDERKDLVAGGRLILSEAHGRKAAEVRGDKFETRLNDAEYRETNEKLTQRTMLFCAKIAAAARGEDAPQTYGEFLKGGRKWAADPNFLRCLQGITSDVIAPMLPWQTLECYVSCYQISWAITSGISTSITTSPAAHAGVRKAERLYCFT